MRKITLQASTGKSIIGIGERLANLPDYIPQSKPIIVTDNNVYRLYSKQFPHYPVIKIGTGEKIKNLKTIKTIFRKFLNAEIDRSSFVVGIGGGIVCDITGFAASTFMRGIPFGFISTSLLSQIDASMGGKNGVNFLGYKNMVGVFNQPDFVICDIEMLRTLPENELRNGFSELVKHAIISDKTLFSFLEDNLEKALSLDETILEELIYRSIKIKAGIVEQDEKESGSRRLLNFGHTFGHAIEKTTGRTHGESVSAGMVAAARLSIKKGLLSEQEAKRIETLLTMLKLPTELKIKKRLVLDAMQKDKKRGGDSINFILLEHIGKPVIKALPIQELEKSLDYIF